MVNESERDRLLRKMETTEEIRHNASRRLEVRAYWSGYLISFLSALVITIGTLSFGRNVSELHQYMAYSSSTFLSVYIIILSMADSGSAYSVKSRQLRSTAYEIGRLAGKLRHMHSASEDQIANIRKEYGLILEKGGVDHSDYDYAHFKIKHPTKLKQGTVVTPNDRNLSLLGYYAWIILPVCSCILATCVIFILIFFE